MISSRQNQKLKNIRRILRSKGDWAQLEGLHLVGEALAAGIVFAEILATPEFLTTAAGHGLQARWASAFTAVSPDALASLSDADAPQGVLALAKIPRLGCASLPRVTGGIYVYADGLQDPGNLGALARVSEAAGACGLALAPESAHPNHPRALRGSAGSLLRLPTAVQVHPEELDVHLLDTSPRWLTLVPRDGADLYLDGEAWDGTLVLAVGAEGPGVSAAVRARAALEITIPLAAPVESLNATVAAALALFEIRRRRGRP